MADGEGRVLSLGPEALAARLNRMPASQAVVLGVPKAGAERFGITTKDRERPGATLADGRPILARTKATFDFPEGPAWMGLDFDTDGMPAEIVELIPGLGDLLDPNILGYDGVARVERSSASAGLVGPDGVARKSDNRHVYLLVKDGRDIPRVVEALYVRSAIHHGALYAKVSKAGTVLPRGLFDKNASLSPERVLFEGDTPLSGGVTRLPGARDAKAYPGRVWNTRAEIPDLTAEERRQFADLCQLVRAEAEPEADRVRAECLARETARLVRDGVTEAQARAAVEARSRGFLHGPDLIRLDDGTTLPLADILNDPGKYPAKPATTRSSPTRETGPSSTRTPRQPVHAQARRRDLLPAAHEGDGVRGDGEGRRSRRVLRFWRPADAVEQEKFAAALAEAQGVTKGAAQGAVKQALKDLPPLPEPREPVTWPICRPRTMAWIPRLISRSRRGGGPRRRTTTISSRICRMPSRSSGPPSVPSNRPGNSTPRCRSRTCWTIPRPTFSMMRTSVTGRPRFGSRRSASRTNSSPGT